MSRQTMGKAKAFIVILFSRLANYQFRISLSNHGGGPAFLYVVCHSERKPSRVE